jgi:hypothetical protein
VDRAPVVNRPGCRSSSPVSHFRYEGAHIHDVPLALLPQQIAIVVRDRGALTEDALPDALAERFGVEVPPSRRRLLASFAWSAGGRKYIEHNGGQWLPGIDPPQPIDHLGSWTMNQIENLVRELVAAGTHPDDLSIRRSPLSGLRPTARRGP